MRNIIKGILYTDDLQTSRYQEKSLLDDERVYDFMSKITYFSDILSFSTKFLKVHLCQY